MKDNDVLHLNKYRKRDLPLVSTPESAKRAKEIEERLDKALEKIRKNEGAS